MAPTFNPTPKDAKGLRSPKLARVTQLRPYLTGEKKYKTQETSKFRPRVTRTYKRSKAGLQALRSLGTVRSTRQTRCITLEIQRSRDTKAASQDGKENFPQALIRACRTLGTTQN